MHIFPYILELYTTGSVFHIKFPINTQSKVLKVCCIIALSLSLNFHFLKNRLLATLGNKLHTQK